jgi:iron complex transport system ATP-binding protein
MTTKNRRSLSEPVFEVNDLNITVKPKASKQGILTGNHLVHGLNWSINAGERWIILGANGCGKSSLLHACAGLALQGRTIHYERLRFAQHAFTPSTANLQRFATLRSYCPQRLDWNLELTPVQLASLLNIDLANDHFTAANLPASWMHQAIGQRSGGEQQRIALALTLTHPAPIVFLDEPLSHLDEVQQMQVLELLKSSGKTIVMVTHHIRLSLGFATHVLMPAASTKLNANDKRGLWQAGVCSDMINSHNLAQAYRVDLSIAQRLLP